MPFIRYARDKRGYESTFVMHAYRAAWTSRARVLYLFRSPSDLKVGRRPLDAEVMEALEHTHPDLAFDWPTLLREPGLPESTFAIARRDRRASAMAAGRNPSAPGRRPSRHRRPLLRTNRCSAGRSGRGRPCACVRVTVSWCSGLPAEPARPKIVTG